MPQRIPVFWESIAFIIVVFRRR